MATININISCEPGELADALADIHASFARNYAPDAHDPVGRVYVTAGLGGYTSEALTLDTEAFLSNAREAAREVTGGDHPSLGEAPADSEGVLAEAKKRTRRTKQQIAEDNERQARIDEARNQAVLEGAPSAHEQKDAVANPVEQTAATDITSSLFSFSAPAETTPPKSETVAPATAGAPEATYEEVQSFVVELGKVHKVPFPKITEVLGKHTSAAGVQSARELSAGQRGIALKELRTLLPA